MLIIILGIVLICDNVKLLMALCFILAYLVLPSCGLIFVIHVKF